MYSISNEYKIACKALTRQSRTKIVVDNITYSGAKYIKDYPKFSHVNKTMIGGFPIKSAEFSLWIKDGKIDLVNKAIKIYRGLVINGSIEWIPQGVFYAQKEDITTSDTGEYITVKCYDGAKDLGKKKYIDNNTYPISETNYIRNVITQAGYEIDEEFFVKSNYIMKQKPNMDDNTSIREIVSRYAEQRGAIALFSRIGKIQIKRPASIEFSYKFYEYKKMTCESLYGPLNQAIIGNKNYNNNIVYPKGEQTFSWTINDNPFLDLIKQERVEEIYNQIKGLTLTPFTLESALDSFLLDINDVITIQKKDMTYQTITILSIETENRLKCKISASVQNKSNIDYSLAGSTKEETKKLRLDVDYNTNKINAVAESQNTIKKEFNFQKTASGSSIHIEDASDNKLVVFEMEGKSEQKTRAGTNYFNASAISNLSIVVENDGQMITMPIIDSGNGYVSTHSTLSELCPTCKAGETYYLNFDRNLGTVNNYFIYLSGSSSIWYANTAKTLTEEEMSGDVAFYANRFKAGETEQVILTDFRITENSTDEWEPFGAMPSPEYPSEIKSLGYENLFDGEIELGSINPSNGVLANSAIRTRSINFIKVKPNTTYSFSREVGQNRWIVGYTKDKVGIADGGYGSYSSAIFMIIPSQKNAIFTTSKTTEYIKWYDTNSTKLDEKVQISIGTILHPYIPNGKYGIAVVNAGKNLFNGKYVNFAIGGSTGHEFFPVNASRTSIVKIEPSTTYTITKFGENTGNRLNIADYPSLVTERTQLNPLFNKNDLLSGTVTTHNNARYLYVYVDNNSNEPLLQIEESHSVSEYESHKERKTLFVLNEPLRSLPNGVADRLFIRNNILRIERKIRTVVFDGVNNLVVFSRTDNANYIVANYNSNLIKRLKDNNQYAPISNKLLPASVNETWNGKKIGVAQAGNGQYLQISLPYSVGTTSDAINAWLAKNNIDTQFELAEPVIEEIGEIEMPSTFKGVNNISTTDELEPIMNITYLTDTPLNTQYASKSEFNITSNKIKMSVREVSSSLDGAKSDISSVQDTLDSQGRTIEIVSTNIDKTTGEVREITTTNGITLNKDGLNFHSSEDSFNTQIDRDSTEYRDGEELVSMTSKDGFLSTNSKEKGKHYYSYNEKIPKEPLNPDNYDFIEERIEVDGEPAYATFWNVEG